MKIGNVFRLLEMTREKAEAILKIFELLIMETYIISNLFYKKVLK
jgi:hypothetical protein